MLAAMLPDSVWTSPKIFTFKDPRSGSAGTATFLMNSSSGPFAFCAPEAEARISPTSPGGFRFVMIDAYQRLGEPFIEKIRSRLLAQKAARRPINGQAMLTQGIEELSGLRYAEFAQRAKITQEAHLAQRKISRPIPQPPATPNPGKD